MRDKRITIQNRTTPKVGKFGKDSGGVKWEDTCTVWASVTWSKGLRAMNEGAIDVYGIVLVRMNWTDKVNVRSRILYDGDTYNILPETFHADKRQNTIQFNAQAVINDK